MSSEPQSIKKHRTDVVDSQDSSNVPLGDDNALFQIDSGGSLVEDSISDLIPLPNTRLREILQLPKSGHLCKYFALGTCTAGSDCRFIHVSAAVKPPCQYFLKGLCRVGVNCRFSHQEVAVCKFFQGLRGCKNASCPFRHVPNAVVPVVVKSTDASKTILDKYSSVKVAESKGVVDLQTR